MDVGSKYKLWMADSLTQTFAQIFDQSGGGKNHCEFVGGSDGDAILGSSLCRDPTIPMKG